jgi:hypothetical protein
MFKILLAVILSSLILDKSVLSAPLCEAQGNILIGKGWRNIEGDPCDIDSSTICRIDPKNSWLWLVKKDSLTTPPSYCDGQTCLTAGAVATQGKGFDANAGEKLESIVNSQALQKLQPDLQLLPRKSSWRDEIYTARFTKKGNKVLDFRMPVTSLYPFQLLYVDSKGKRTYLKDDESIYKLVQVKCGTLNSLSPTIVHYWWLKSVKKDYQEYIPFDIFIQISYFTEPKPTGAVQKRYTGF